MIPEAVSHVLKLIGAGVRLLEESAYVLAAYITEQQAELEVLNAAVHDLQCDAGEVVYQVECYSEEGPLGRPACWYVWHGKLATYSLAVETLHNAAEKSPHRKFRLMRVLKTVVIPHPEQD